MKLVALVFAWAVALSAADTPQRKTGFIHEDEYISGDSNICANCVAAFSEVKNIPLDKISKDDVFEKILFTGLKATLKVDSEDPLESLELFGVLADFGKILVEQVQSGSKAVDGVAVCQSKGHCPKEAEQLKVLLAKDTKKFKSAFVKFFTSTSKPKMEVNLDEAPSCPARKNGMASSQLAEGENNKCANCIYALKQIKSTPFDDLDKRAIKVKLAQEFSKSLGKNIAIGLTLMLVPGGQPFAMPAALVGAGKDTLCTVIDEVGPATLQYVRTGAYKREVSPEQFCQQYELCPKDDIKTKVLKHADEKPSLAKFWAMFKIGQSIAGH